MNKSEPTWRQWVQLFQLTGRLECPNPKATLQPKFGLYSNFRWASLFTSSWKQNRGQRVDHRDQKNHSNASKSEFFFFFVLNTPKVGHDSIFITISFEQLETRVEDFLVKRATWMAYRKSCDEVWKECEDCLSETFILMQNYKIRRIFQLPRFILRWRRTHIWPLKPRLLNTFGMYESILTVFLFFRFALIHHTFVHLQLDEVLDEVAKNQSQSEESVRLLRQRAESAVNKVINDESKRAWLTVCKELATIVPMVTLTIKTHIHTIETLRLSYDKVESHEIEISRISPLSLLCCFAQATLLSGVWFGFFDFGGLRLQTKIYCQWSILHLKNCKFFPIPWLKSHDLFWTDSNNISTKICYNCRFTCKVGFSTQKIPSKPFGKNKAQATQASHSKSKSERQNDFFFFIVSDFRVAWDDIWNIVDLWRHTLCGQFKFRVRLEHWLIVIDRLGTHTMMKKQRIWLI